MRNALFWVWCFKYPFLHDQLRRCVRWYEERYFCMHATCQTRARHAQKQAHSAEQEGSDERTVYSPVQLRSWAVGCNVQPTSDVRM